MKVRELGGFIRDQRNSARLSLRKLSSLTGVSNPYLSQIERGLRRPSADILQAIAKALRISAETLYVQAGILDERSDSDPVGEIRRDKTLSERQKQILIELYQSFREGGAKTKTKATTKATTKAAARARAAKSVVGPKRSTSGRAAKRQPAKRSAAPRKRIAAARRATGQVTARKRVTRKR